MRPAAHDDITNDWLSSVDGVCYRGSLREKVCSTIGEVAYVESSAVPF